MFSTKKIFLVFSIIISSFSFSQDAELFENTWYLHHFESNGETHSHVPNNEVTSITLNFGGIHPFTTKVCNDLFDTSLQWNNDNSFTFLVLHQTLALCQNPYNLQFEPLYFQFYYKGNSLSQPHYYQIINNSDNSKTLIITNYLGEEAVYANYQLSVSSYEKQIVSFYPNPTKDILHIKYETAQNQLNISIFDVNGKIVLNTSNTSLNQIDISNLKKGIYFIKVETLDGKIQIEKIIKQ